MLSRLSKLLAFVVILGSTARLVCAEPLTHNGLDAGYYDMYNLDFAGAHQVFGSVDFGAPAGPNGPRIRRGSVPVF